MDCSSITGFREKKDWNKVCKFDLSRDLGQNNPCIKQDDFGYDDGQPCVLIKLNKVITVVGLVPADLALRRREFLYYFHV